MQSDNTHILRENIIYTTAKYIQSVGGGIKIPRSHTAVNHRLMISRENLRSPRRAILISYTMVRIHPTNKQPWKPKHDRFDYEVVHYQKMKKKKN